MSPNAHWLDVYEPEDEDMHETTHHACLRIIHGNGGAHYHAVKDEPALTADGSGYSARLIVLPTFSCALHEAKVCDTHMFRHLDRADANARRYARNSVVRSLREERERVGAAYDALTARIEKALHEAKEG